MIFFRPCSVLAMLGMLVAPSGWGAQGSANPEQNTLLGHWVTKGYESVVDIKPCAENEARLCGHIVWLWDAVDGAGRPVLDTENPDSDLRRQPLLGRMIVIQMAPGKGSDLTASGRIYNPGDGRTYRASIELIDATTLQVEGCVMFLCQSQVWRRPSVFPRYENNNA